MSYEFLLLDLDDTIFDFSGGERSALSQALSEWGIALSDQMAKRYAAINDGCWKMLEKGQIEKERLIVCRFELFFREFGIKADAAAVNRRYMEHVSEKAVFLPGAESFLQRVRGKYRLFLITNGTAWVQRKRIAASGIAQYFEGIFISEEVGAKKPDVLFFERVAESIDGFSRKKALVMGDSPSSDMLGAENYGLDAIWFNPSGKENTVGVKPRYTVCSYEQAEKILNV